MSLTVIILTRLRLRRAPEPLSKSVIVDFWLTVSFAGEGAPSHRAQGIGGWGFRRELRPLKVLASVHYWLPELGEPDMFVTLFYGVVDTRTQELTYHSTTERFDDMAILVVQAKGDGYIPSALRA